MRAPSRRSFLATAGGAAVAATVVAPPVRAAQVSWKCGSANSLDYPVVVRLTEAFSKVKAETKGAFEITLFPNSSLGGDSAMVDQVRVGAIDMMHETGGILDSFFPLASIENVPFAFPDQATAFRAMDGDVGKLIRSQFPAHGIYAMEKMYDNGFRSFATSTKPIHVVDDLKGVKLRVSPSKFRLDIFQSMGAATTAIVPAELYTALQTHVVDGLEAPLQSIEDWRVFEVQRYCSLSKHMWGGFWVLINKAKWDGLAPEFQAVLTKHVNAGAMLDRRDSIARESSIRDKLRRQGLTFNDVDPSSFKTKLSSTGFYNRWKAAFGPAAWTALEKYSGPLG